MGFRDHLQRLVPISMSFAEPLTTLQRLGEVMEYTELLDSADICTDPLKRLALVTAFVITPYAAHERPFNPLPSFLGETLHLVCGNNVQFMAEQVSIEPSIAVAHGENGHFTYDIVSSARMEFRARSVYVIPQSMCNAFSSTLEGMDLGRCHIKLKRTGEVFSVIPVTTKIHHPKLAGYVDHYGELRVTNNATKEKATVEFLESKTFGKEKGNIKGTISLGELVDDVPVEMAVLRGMWNSHVDYQTKEPSTGRRGELIRLWTCTPKPRSDPWQRSHFAMYFSTTDNGMELLMSDARRRADVMALMHGDHYLAMDELLKLKKQQKKEEQWRMENNDAFTPVHFEKMREGVIYQGDHPASVVPCYQWTGPFPEEATKLTATQILGIGYNPWMVNALRHPHHDYSEQETFAA